MAPGQGVASVSSAASAAALTDSREPNRDGLSPNEQRFRAVFENTPECIKIIACDGSIVSMNPAGLALVEAEAQSDVIGRCVFDLIAPEFRDAFRDLHDKVCAGQKCELDYEIVGLKGARRWMQTHAAPIQHPVTGQPAHLAVTRDVTSRKHAERAIQLNEERLRLATLSDAITLYEQDEQLRYTWLYPLKPEYAKSLGKTDSEILPNEEGAFLERIKSEVMRTGQSQRHIVPATFPERTTYYDLLILPRRSFDGCIIGVAGSALDVTHRKNAEDALRTAELRWRSVTEALPNLVWTDLPDGQCDWLSPQWGQYTGIPERELLGLGWLERVIHPEDRKHTLECWQNACADKAPYDLEYRIRRHDGQYRWFKTRGAPVRDANGKIIYWFGTCTDIDDLKRTEAYLVFLSDLSASLASTESSAEIAKIAARLLCNHYNASRVNFADIDLARSEATVFASERAPGLKEDRITHQLRQYLPNSIIQELQAGRVIAIDDIRLDPRTAPFAENYNQWAIGSMILAPQLTESGWRFLMVLHKAEPCSWQPAEIKQIPEITARIHSRIERARALEALRENEGRLRELLEALPAAVYTTDAQGRVTMFNQAAVEFWGRVPQIGTDSWCVSLKLYTPDGRPLAYEECPMAIALREGRAVKGCEAIAERPDGTRIHFIPYPTPLRSLDGKIVGAINMLVDITERKRAEENAARLAAIVEHSDDAIFSADTEGVIRSWNRGAERLYGYLAGEVVGRNISILVPEGHQDEQPRFLELIWQGQTVENYETIRRRKDESLLHVSLTVSPVKDSSGRIIGISKVARDITEKVRSREMLEQTVAERTASLEQALAQMEDFTYSVSHDLRAPVRSIRGLAGAAIEDYGAAIAPELRGFIDQICASADRMDQLIRDILDYSRVSRTDVKLAPVELDSLISAIISQRPDLQPKRAKIQIRAPLGPVLAHEPSLAQAVTNLLANAVKFVHPGTQPVVELWTERHNGFVRLWVSDNGLGVNPRYQHRLFNVFERVHTSPNYEGTGIGLAIVRKAAEKMGGKVGLVSDGKSGSKFWIELPSATN